MINKLNTNVVQLSVHEKLVRSGKCFTEGNRTSLTLRNRYPEFEERIKTDRDRRYSEVWHILPWLSRRGAACDYFHLTGDAMSASLQNHSKFLAALLQESKVRSGGGNMLFTEVLTS